MLRAEAKDKEHCPWLDRGGHRIELVRDARGEEQAMRVTGEIVIERPIERVFDFVADERNEPLYNPRMNRAEKITPGPIGVGTRFGSEMTGVGREAEMTIEFTEFDRPHRIAET